MQGRKSSESRSADCWACTAAAACLSSEEADKERWSIISDIDRFLRIGFLLGWRKELDLLSREEGKGEELGMAKGFELMVWRGPYSHVTSQSLSLNTISVNKCILEREEEREREAEEMWEEWKTYQFNVSGLTVPSPYLAFIHVLQLAFSNRAELE